MTWEVNLVVGGALQFPCSLLISRRDFDRSYPGQTLGPAELLRIYAVNEAIGFFQPRSMRLQFLTILKFGYVFGPMTSTSITLRCFG